MPEDPQVSGRPEQGSDGPAPEVWERIHRKTDASALGAAGKYAGLGLQFALSILLFLYLGRWVDGVLGTEPLFLVLGVFLGAGAAFYSMVRRLMAEAARDAADRKAGERRP